MREAVERLWAAAQEETRKEIERLTEAMNARVAEAVAERDGALAELQSTVEEVQGWQGKAAALEGELKDARQEAEQVRTGLASAAERAGQAEARAGEIERRADGLQAELGRVHEEAKAERERQAAAIAAGQGELDRLREELASLKATAQAEQRSHADAPGRPRSRPSGWPTRWRGQGSIGTRRDGRQPRRGRTRRGYRARSRR